MRLGRALTSKITGRSNHGSMKCVPSWYTWCVVIFVVVIIWGVGVGEGDSGERGGKVSVSDEGVGCVCVGVRRTSRQPQKRVGRCLCGGCAATAPECHPAAVCRLLLLG